MKSYVKNIKMTKEYKVCCLKQKQQMRRYRAKGCFANLSAPTYGFRKGG